MYLSSIMLIMMSVEKGDAKKTTLTDADSLKEIRTLL